MKDGTPDDLAALVAEQLVGQRDAIDTIVPFVEMYRAGLSPERRPAGIFLLLGPTGTGKTRTVEALARVLHGDDRKLLQINCGELQAEHEMARLVGAPPGYIGHRETKPLLTQDALGAAAGAACDLSLVLFDEVEKAAPSLMRLLLGVFDKGQLQLGDGTTVDFTRTMIFLTSNLGARDMMRALSPRFGFQASGEPTPPSRLDGIGSQAVRRFFNPEVINRLDAVVTYQPLDADALSDILDHQLDDLRRHVRSRLGRRTFEIEVAPAAREFLLVNGTSAEYGARELRRTIQRHLTQPLAMMITRGAVAPGSRVTVEMRVDGGLEIQAGAGGAAADVETAAQPVVLVVDRHREHMKWLGDVLGEMGYAVLLANSAAEARARLRERHPDAVLVDLDDAARVDLTKEILDLWPLPQVITMTGDTAHHDAALRAVGVPVLRKPFLGSEVAQVVGGAKRAATRSSELGTRNSELGTRN